MSSFNFEKNMNKIINMQLRTLRFNTRVLVEFLIDKPTQKTDAFSITWPGVC